MVERVEPVVPPDLIDHVCKGDEVWQHCFLQSGCRAAENNAALEFAKAS